MDATMRLDRYLAQRLSRFSRSQLQRLISKSCVIVNGRQAKVSYPVRAGDEISVVIPEPTPSEQVPEPIPFQILFEDEAILVIDKPAGLVVHPAPGHARGTLVNALLYYFPAFGQEGAPERCGLVHRLDKGTSGVMVVAKTVSALTELSRQFHDRTVVKRYWALVYGHLIPPVGSFTASLGRHPKHRKKFSSRAPRGRGAETRYEVLSERGPFSVVRLIPKTGRTHQIRVHLSEAGHPIVGDPTYGGRRWQALLPVPLREAIAAGLGRPALHAIELGFHHPESNEYVVFQSDISDDLKSFMNILHRLLPPP